MKEPTYIKSAMYVFQVFSELNLKILGTSLARHLRTFLTWDIGSEKTSTLQYPQELVGMDMWKKAKGC